MHSNLFYQKPLPLGGGKLTRDGDRTSGTINMVRNKRTGVVIATPSVEVYEEWLEDNGKDADDYEVVESKLKDVKSLKETSLDFTSHNISFDK